MSASTAPVPETTEGLLRQNSAYRTLCASLEAQQAIHTRESQKYHEAITTLDSEREANARLTEEVERLREALQLVWDAYGFDPSIDSGIWQTVIAALNAEGAA